MTIRAMIENLITFGCSWTYGVGITYTESKKSKFLEKAFDKEICNRYSFRGQLSKKFNSKNINFSYGGSSNQDQFFKAMEYFPKCELPNTLVLWGITSLYRYPFYDVHEGKTKTVFLSSQEDPISKIIKKNHFDESNELDRLEKHILFFNDYFQKKKIKNYWFNTFNTHKFKNKIDNLLFNGNDLLSIMVNDFTDDNQYHLSNWHDVDKKIKKALKLKLVNPISQHPTIDGHTLIADAIQKELGMQ
jgi:hypothetical protein